MLGKRIETTFALSPIHPLKLFTVGTYEGIHPPPLPSPYSPHISITGISLCPAFAIQDLWTLCMSETVKLHQS